MNSPHRVHPALPLEQRDNMVPFKSTTAKAQIVEPSQAPSRLERLVTLEADIRRQNKSSALSLHAVNETRNLVGFDQAFHLRFNRRQKLVIVASSSVARIELHAPLLRAIVADVMLLENFEKPSPLLLKTARTTESYPFANGFWSPFLDSGGKCFGGLLFARSAAFAEGDAIIAARIGQTYSHAFRALTPPSMLRLVSLPRWLLVSTPIALLALFLIPVPMTSLAPFEVVAKEPIIVTASIDGAIAEVVAEPNSNVKKGDLLFRFDVTILQADAKIAEQRMLVAEAKLATAKNSAFSDAEAKRSMAELQTGVDLANAEFQYATSLLERASVRAASDGLLIYATKSDWIGKPVSVGEKIMEIADPAFVEYRADLSVHDAISLDVGGQVKLFLDADPLNPRAGKIAEMSYHATEVAGGTLAYRIRVEPDGTKAAERIGLRGIAQISGEDVSLGFYLFRRPIAALRQYFGM
jgi:multidrug resistance efflux pump